jgi:hypothetical protein
LIKTWPEIVSRVVYELTKVFSSSSSRTISTSLGLLREKDCNADDLLLPGSMTLDMTDDYCNAGAVKMEAGWCLAAAAAAAIRILTVTR